MKFKDKVIGSIIHNVVEYYMSSLISYHIMLKIHMSAPKVILVVFSIYYNKNI